MEQKTKQKKYNDNAMWFLVGSKYNII